MVINNRNVYSTSLPTAQQKQPSNMGTVSAPLHPR